MHQLQKKPDRQWRSSSCCSFQECKKVRVSRDLWPWPWAHPGCTLTWSPSCASLVAIRPFVCEKRFAQKFTDRRTDDGRRAIALAHSWNELMTKIHQWILEISRKHIVSVSDAWMAARTEACKTTSGAYFVGGGELTKGNFFLGGGHRAVSSTVVSSGYNSVSRHYINKLTQL